MRSAPNWIAVDVSIVPIRCGQTPSKVIEAMAHHIPIVSTAVGCEGIDLVDGTHALIADDPLTFVDACLSLLASGQERQRLADASVELFEQRYTWDAIGDRVVDLVREVTSSEPTLD